MQVELPSKDKGKNKGDAKSSEAVKKYEPYWFENGESLNVNM